MLQHFSIRFRGLSKLPLAVRYFVSVLLMLAVFAVVELASGETLPRAPYIAFLPAVILCAVLFDRGSSLLALAVAAGLSLFAFVPPAGGFAEVNGRDLFGLAFFVGTGVASAAIVEALRHAVEKLAEANAALVHANAEVKAQGVLLDAIVEQSADAIYIKDREGRFVHLNAPAARILGVTAEQALGRRDRDFLAPEQADVIEAVDREVIATRAVRAAEELATTPGGGTVCYLSKKAPWLDPDGNVAGVIGVSRDIDERKQAEDALKAADAQKQLLLYDINHRVKNHLQTVVGLMSVATRRVTDLDGAREALRDAASRLSVLGRVYTRLQLEHAASVVDAQGFIEELCAELKASLVDGRALAMRVEADAVMLESSRAVTLGLAINELVQNALKYAFPDDRPGTVRVGFHRDGNDYVLAVADDGIGFVATAATQGNGTGQRLVRGMAQQLGGEVTVAGPPGTSVTLRFPVAADPATQV